MIEIRWRRVLFACCVRIFVVYVIKFVAVELLYLRNPLQFFFTFTFKMNISLWGCITSLIATVLVKKKYTQITSLGYSVENNFKEVYVVFNFLLFSFFINKINQLFLTKEEKSFINFYLFILFYTYTHI